MAQGKGYAIRVPQQASSSGALQSDSAYIISDGEWCERREDRTSIQKTNESSTLLIGSLLMTTPMGYIVTHHASCACKSHAYISHDIVHADAGIVLAVTFYFHV